MTTTRTYDLANRLLKIESFNAQPSTLSSFNYDYNSANQRTLRREADGSYWRYEYDSLGQVISGKKYWSDGTPVPGQQFEYAFDDIGNRTGTKAGGDANGANLRNADYSANLLNQYTSRTVPGVVDVMGVGFATNTVTVNSQATYRKGEYFRKEVAVANSSTPVWQSITVSAAGQTNIAGNSFVVKTPEIFGYDLDGNLTNDGRWAYSWDAENRLVSMVARTSTGPQQRLDFGYDWRGRRIMKKVWNNTLGTGAPSVDRLFAYDGWNLISELGPLSTVHRSFAWGLDLSGSLQGAGGVGGLLWVNDPSTLNSQPSTHLVSFDGNGNVVALFNATDSSETVRYEYGPFGEVIRMTGQLCPSNPFRFSTKYQDDETDLLYYGYRYYNASTGRWLSKDPIEEGDGPALMSILGNDVVGRYDFVGLCDPEGGGQCGPDVTVPVTATLANIRTEFESWNWGKKVNACTALYGLYARGAWGMDKVTLLGFGIWGFNPPAVQGSPAPCTTTIAYKGTCYQASDVNYLMWGAINKMCWRSVTHRVSLVWSLSWAQAAAIAWKAVHEDPWRRMVGAVSFTRAGWQEQNFDLNFAERWFVEEGSCAINSNNKASEASLKFQWWPNSVIWPLKIWPL